ncbi:FecR domain-containing protein [Parabacteroides sp. OttesenSCG-928-K15]|nr:FecR domain-containing protein [Parabacteroides sp. OttesenSCG-928-K15]
MDERIIQYFLGKLTEEERIELLRLRESDPVIRHKFDDYQNAQALLSLSPQAKDGENGEKQLLHFMRAKRKNNIRRIAFTSLKYAAAVCVLVAATWFIATSYPNIMPNDFLTGKQELYIPSGQRARITLPDGTSVWLNAQSTLQYPSVFKKERKVRLSGEAYFDVAKHRGKPFIVETEHFNIMALGTAFNVCSYPGSVSHNTILVEGSVKIYKPNEESAGIILTPNQQLFYENGIFSTKMLADKDVLLWKEGIYCFKDECLDSIIKKLELYFDVKIDIVSPSLLEKKYTGKFRQNDGVMEILRIIQKIHPFKIEKNEELNQITLSR